MPTQGDRPAGSVGYRTSFGLDIDVGVARREVLREVVGAMQSKDLTPFRDYLETTQLATNETQKREAFVVLAARGFGDQQFATNLALGAEYQVRFESAGLIRRGAVDSFYENLIIEFEYDLTKTRKHALEQLRGYLAGGWRAEGTADRPYLAVATDGIQWEVYSATLIDPSHPIDEYNIELHPSEVWPGTREPEEASLRDFLNRLFFRKSLVRPTAANFAKDFGLGSPAFLSASAELTRKIEELADDPQLEVLQGAWFESLQIAYGSLDTDNELFVTHTYLAVLARLLVWATLERRIVAPGELEEILDGRYFVGRRVANLVEDDYFHWYQIASSSDANRVWLSLARHLATYDLSAVDEDILKPLYEQLVDPETRHELGEYYTPDWLASLVTDHVLKGWDWERERIPAVLDPTCGSGTFLRSAIEVVRRESKLGESAELLSSILEKIMGIDVHPLAVTVARATYLIAIKDLLPVATRPMAIPVFLANSLQMPRAEISATLFGDRVPLKVSGRTFNVPEDFVRNSRDFEEALDDVLAVARAFGRRGELKDVDIALRARINGRLDHYEYSSELLDALGGIAHRISKLIRGRRDSVHGFMLRNHYRPAMLKHTFDFVVGNPPWLTVADVNTPDYKRLIVHLATEANIAPRSAGEQAHTEIASLFLWGAANEFLKLDGPTDRPQIGLVMPRSVFTASHHRLLREGAYRGVVDVDQLWDLEGLTPLFNVPASVVFATRRQVRPTLPKPGRVFDGRLPEKDLPWRQAMEHVRWSDTIFRLGFLGKRSAWVQESSTTIRSLAESSAASGNAYASQFRQGAVIYPQTLFVVELNGHGPPTRNVRTVRVRTNSDATKTAKVLKDIEVNHVVDARNLFLTAASEHVLPYALDPNLWVIVLPTIQDPGEPGFGPVDSDALRLHGRVDTATWLDWAEGQWESVRKRTDQTSLVDRLDHMGQLRSQGEMKDYVVIYTATGHRPVACVIDVSRLSLPFVVRDQTYWASFDSPDSAYFLVAILNSEFIARAIQAWMTRGLFGPRHIHKRALDVPWPSFDQSDPIHLEVVAAARSLTAKSVEAIRQLPPITSGRKRAWIRDQLDPGVLQGLENLVSKISGG